MQEYRKKQRTEKERKRLSHNARMRLYRDGHRTEIRAYERDRWHRRQAKKKLAAMMAARDFILASDKTPEEKLAALEHLNRQADALMREVGIETKN